MIRKVVFVALLMVLAMALFAACGTGGTTLDEVAEDPNANIAPPNVLADGEYSIDVDIPGECFFLKVWISTSYLERLWAVLDTKDLLFKAYPVFGTDCRVVDVYTTSFYASVSLEAGHPSLDGVQQDSIFVEYRLPDQPGFYISEDHPFWQQFVVEGRSDELRDAWEFATSNYSEDRITRLALNETNLVRDGKLRQLKLQFVVMLAAKDQEGVTYMAMAADRTNIPVAQ